MVSRALFSDLGGFVAVGQALVPQAAHTAGAVDGAEIDRAAVSGDGALYSSACLVINHGAVSGGPSAISVEYKIQHSATSGGVFTDYDGSSPITVTAASTSQKLSVDLRGAQRFIRVQATFSYPGGTAPALFASSSFVFIDEKKR